MQDIPAPFSQSKNKIDATVPGCLAWMLLPDATPLPALLGRHLGCLTSLRVVLK
jgi:hypothetical protein